MDPAESELYELQQAPLSILEGEVRWKPWPLPEYEHVFKGTRLALARPQRRRGSPPAHSLACPFLEIRLSLTRTPTSRWHSGSASDLGLMEAGLLFRQGEAAISGGE